MLRKDGTLWLNLGDSYGGSGKGRSGGGQGPSSGKQLTNRGAYFDIDKGKRNGNGHGRYGGGGQAGKQLMGIPWRVALALQADGWYLRSDIIWHKPNPMPESIQDRPTKSHEYIFLMSKSARYYYDAKAIQEPAATGWRGSSFTDERDVATKPGLGMGKRNGNGGGNYSKRYAEAQPAHGGESNREDTGFRHKRDVWTIAPQNYSGAHFAVWPEKLVEPMILAGSKRGDIVLDPFSGSGTTGRVAFKHGRRYVGLDLNPEYMTLAEERTAVIQMAGL